MALFWSLLELRKDVKLRKALVSVKLTILNLLFLLSVSGNMNIFSFIIQKNMNLYKDDSGDTPLNC